MLTKILEEVRERLRTAEAAWAAVPIIDEKIIPKDFIANLLSTVNFSVPLHTDIARLLRIVEVQRSALDYCAIDPGLLHTANNCQHVTASNAIAQANAIAAGEGE